MSMHTHAHTRTHTHTHTHPRTLTDSCVKRPKDPYHVAKGALLCGLCLGVKLDVYFPGFPSLKFIQHSASLEKRGVRVFQAASREDNMCLTVLPRSDLPTVGCRGHR